MSASPPPDPDVDYLLRYAVAEALEAGQQAWRLFFNLRGLQDAQDARDAAKKATAGAYKVLTHRGLDEDVALLIASALCPFAMKRTAIEDGFDVLPEGGGA